MIFKPFAKIHRSVATNIYIVDEKFLDKMIVSLASFIIGSLYLMIPAYVANMTPPLLKEARFLDYPIDMGLKFKNKRIFGSNKTLRGLIAGTLTGTAAFWIQKEIFFLTKGFAIINYDNFSLFLGALLSLGALMGDCAESFFKRQRDHPPGTPWIPWDQIDFVIGALILSLFMLKFSFIRWSVIIVTSGILHIIINRISYIMHLQKNKY